MSIFKKPVPRLTLLIEVDVQTKQIVVKGCIDDTLTAMHMLADAMQIVLKRSGSRVEAANGNGGGHA